MSATDFARRLAAERARLGMTHRQLADALGASKRAVTYWLSGDRLPKPQTRVGILATLATHPSAKTAAK